MRKQSVLFGLIGVLLLQGCVKSTDSDDDIIGNWIRRSDFEGKARTEAICAVTNNGKAYIGLGFDGTNRLLDFWVYDANEDSWNRKDSFSRYCREILQLVLV